MLADDFITDVKGHFEPAEKNSVPKRRASIRRAPPAVLLGIAFDAINFKETVRRIGEMIASREPHYVCTANVDFLVQARRDAELRRILNGADLTLCDGTPLV